MKALIIVDMLNDFVDGSLANPRAQEIVAPLSRLLGHAREDGWVVVFSNDAHKPGDPELKVWGEHAMAGTPGAQVIPQLAPRDGEIISDKQHYGAFDETGLAEQLRERGVDEVVITGQHTHICVRHPRTARCATASRSGAERRRVRVRGRGRGRGARVPEDGLRRERHDGRRARGAPVAA